MQFDVTRAPRVRAPGPASKRNGPPQAPRGTWLKTVGPLTWALAGIVSVALLAAVAWQLDAAALAAALDAASWRLLGAALVLLLAEQLIAAARMHWIAGGSGGFGNALRVTAWHGAWLIALPMRLGDVAWMVVMRRAYGWNAAAAVACAFLQRLLDIAVVAACLLLTAPAIIGLNRDAAPLVAALAVAVFLLAFVGAVTLRIWLSLGAGLLVAAGPPRGWRRRLLRELRHGQRWLESVRNRRIMPLLLLATVGEWATVFGAWWAVALAFGLQVQAAQFVAAAAAGSLITALPVQSIGGAGLLEASLTGILAWIGAPVAAAALVALAIRAVSLAATGVFCLAVALASARRSGW